MLRAISVATLLLAAQAPAQAHNNFVYQVFVRSFADTPTDPDATGDLRGLREQLDYINDGRPGKGNDLEAGILWLMPIFPTSTYHGYDIEDYRTVNPEYGTMADLEALLRSSHKRGVRVILDVAFNHTSNRHPWFLEAVRDSSSRFRKFYFFQADDGSARPNMWHVTGSTRYFGLFGPNMPDLNLAEPAVREEIKAIAKFWLDRGVDGFRLDAAKHIFDDGIRPLGLDEIGKNNAWWREFSDYVYSVKRDAILVGEVLGNADMLRQHAPGLDALLDEPFLERTRNFLVSPRPGYLRQQTERKPFQSWEFLGSHDRTPRLATLLQQPQTYRLAMYLLFAIGTHPVLYNGDELMQPGVKWRGNPRTSRDEPGDGSRIYDETLREPFPWYRKLGAKPPQTNWFASRYDKSDDGISVEEQNTPESVLATVRALGRLRVEHPQFANGEIESILTDTAQQLVFVKGSYLALINVTASSSKYHLPAEWTKATTVFRSDNAARKNVESEVLLPPHGFVLLQRRKL